MDFIIQLPKTKGGHDAVAVFVDRLTKMVRLAATTTEVSAEGAADLLVQHVVRHHGLRGGHSQMPFGPLNFVR